LSYVAQIWFYRFAVWVVPIVVLVVARRICFELQGKEHVEHERHRAELEGQVAQT
jgi:hypothetical protein